MSIARASRRVAFALVALVGLAAAGLALAGALYRPSLVPPPDLGGSYVTVAGNPIRYKQWGRGPDVLLIHGSPGSLEDWEPVVAPLAATHRVTAYDRPGSGYSGDADNPSTHRYHADVALALIDALQLKDVIVVGHSYGGTTALAMAIRNPSAVKAAVILDSTPYPAERAEALYHALALPLVGTGIARVVAPLVGPKKIRAGIDRAFGGISPGEAFYSLRARIWSQPKVNHSMAEERVRFNDSVAELSPHYREIRRPVFILGPARDPERRARLERLHADVAGSRLKLIESAHYIQYQQPQEVVDAVAAVEAGGSDSGPAKAM
jgi:pimeloyl-ACP methyl ester carboxylesterase